MKLEVGKKYKIVLNSYGDNEISSSVLYEVVSYMTYSQAQPSEFPYYNIHISAINKGIIVDDDNDDQTESDTYNSYFKNKLFYNCRRVNGSAEKTNSILLWDEIINETATELIGDSVTMLVQAVIPDSSPVQGGTELASDVRSFIENHIGLTNEDSEDLSVDVVTSTTSEQDLLREKLNKYENILQNLSKLESFIPVLERLQYSKNVLTSIETIENNLSSINQKISEIASNL